MGGGGCLLLLGSLILQYIIQGLCTILSKINLCFPLLSMSQPFPDQGIHIRRSGALESPFAATFPA